MEYKTFKGPALAAAAAVFVQQYLSSLTICLCVLLLAAIAVFWLSVVVVSLLVSASANVYERAAAAETSRAARRQTVLSLTPSRKGRQYACLSVLRRHSVVRVVCCRHEGNFSCTCSCVVSPTIRTRMWLCARRRYLNLGCHGEYRSPIECRLRGTCACGPSPDQLSSEYSTLLLHLHHELVVFVDSLLRTLSCYAAPTGRLYIRR